jgi:hypothetical protein
MSLALFESSLLRAVRPGSGGALRLRRLLLVFWTGLFVLHSLLYLALIPPWQAPDEPTSMELLLTIESRGRLVSPADQDLEIQRAIVGSMEQERYWELGAYGRQPTWQEKIFANVYRGSTQLHRPPLYQLILLPVAWLVNDWPVGQQLLVLRAATILIGALTVAAITLISYELAGALPVLPLVVPALVALHPQFAYSSATFNSDNLVALLSAFLFLILLRLLRHGITFPRLALLCLLVALGFFTKRTFLFVLPFLGFGIMWQLWRLWRSGSTRLRRRLFYGGIGMLGSTVLLLLLPGVWSGVAGLIDRFVFNASRTNDRGVLLSSLLAAPSLLQPWLTRSLPFLSRSFWGSYGWHQVVIGPLIAQVLLTLVCATWTSALIWLIVRRRVIADWLRCYLWLGLGAILLTIGIALLSAPPTLNMLPQGRYLFPVFVPILLLMGIGLCWWWPRRWTASMLRLIWLSLIGLDLYCIMGIVIPGFYR